MVECKICGAQFKSLITSTHLKRHNMKTSDYIDKFGRESISSDEHREKASIRTRGENNPNYGKTHTAEAREKISNSHIGKSPHNKGKKLSGDELIPFKKAAEKRELRYQNGELIRKVHVPSEELREHLSIKTKEYAANNPEKMKERAAKAKNTRIKNGNTTGSMKGKKHSTETLEKLKKISYERAIVKKEETKQRRIEFATEHGYRLVEFTQNGKNVILACGICAHEFSRTIQYLTKSKISKEMCPVCYPLEVRVSSSETELYNFIKTLAPDAVQSCRYVLSGNREIDIYIPSKKIGFEYNGLYWHSEEVLGKVGKSPTSDLEKLNESIGLGIRLVQIFEDEYKLKPEIVKNRIAHILGVTNSVKIHARKCTVQKINYSQTKEFLDTYHIQGSSKSLEKYGLFYNNELVSVMTFTKSNISRKNTHTWELEKFAVKSSYSIPGAATKLFSSFIREHGPDEVITYSDRRWNTGMVYQHIGFEFVHNTAPNYWYLEDNSLNRIHRFNLRKNKDDDQSLTEVENRINQGYKRIFDSGSSKWRWTKK